MTGLVTRQIGFTVVRVSESVVLVPVSFMYVDDYARSLTNFRSRASCPRTVRNN